MTITDIIDSIDDRIDHLEYIERIGESDIKSHAELDNLISMRRIAGGVENISRITGINP